MMEFQKQATEIQEAINTSIKNDFINKINNNEITIDYNNPYHIKVMVELLVTLENAKSIGKKDEEYIDEESKKFIEKLKNDKEVYQILNEKIKSG